MIDVGEKWLVLRVGLRAQKIIYQPLVESAMREAPQGRLNRVFGTDNNTKRQSGIPCFVTVPIQRERLSNLLSLNFKQESFLCSISPRVFHPLQSVN